MAETPKISPTKHVKVVFSVLGCVIVAAVAARWLAYPKTYGDLGRFRAAALPQAMNIRAPLHTDGEKCVECHKEITRAQWKDVHENVQCDACHGPGGRHIDEEKKVAVARPDADKLIVDRTADQCLTCHRRLAARPASFPQIEQQAHFAMLHLATNGVSCLECHDPHQPLFLDKNIREARMHPVVNRCVDCHKHEQDLKAEKPEDHPVLFECAYCHKAVAKDFATRGHKNLECNACHQVYPVSERAVRVVSHRDPKFCLLCHSDKLAKDQTGPPGIKWPAHIEDVADDFEKDKNKVCVDCHQEAYHLSPGPAEIKIAAPVKSSAKEKSDE